jgi:RNA polymerase sigma-70 factor (ECF subfamily)
MPPDLGTPLKRVPISFNELLRKKTIISYGYGCSRDGVSELATLSLPLAALRCRAFFEKNVLRIVTRARVATCASMNVTMSAVEKTTLAEGEHALHAAPGFLNWVAALVHSHRSRLLGYARRRGLDAEEALDVVQDSFASFMRLPEARTIAHEGDDSLKLLTVLVRHNVQNYRRKRRRRSGAQTLVEAEFAEQSSETSEELIGRAEELARVHGCILRMANLQREVVQLSLLDEQPRERVAELLGISDGYVRVLLHRAREHVRACSYIYADPNRALD